MSRIRRRGAAPDRADDLQAPGGRPLRVRLLQLRPWPRARRDDPVRQRPLQGAALLRRLNEQWEESNCYTGVFMQNIIVDRQMHRRSRSTPTTRSIPATRCEHRYKGALLPDADLVHPARARLRLPKGFEICDGVEAEFVDTCYVSMGRDISGNSHREAGRIVELCSLGKSELQEHCYMGAVGNDVFHDHGLANANELCAIVPERFRTICENARDTAVATL